MAYPIQIQSDPQPPPNPMSLTLAGGRGSSAEPAIRSSGSSGDSPSPFNTQFGFKLIIIFPPNLPQLGGGITEISARICRMSRVV